VVKNNDFISLEALVLKKRVMSLAICLLLIFPLSVFAEKAPLFKLPTDKSNISLSAYRGKKIVYVDFWASWCDPCRKSFPWMAELQKRYKSNLKIIAINLDEKRSDANTFLKQVPAGFTVAFDPENEVAEAYKLPGMPTSFLIDLKGNIVSKHIGVRSKEKQAVEKNIVSLIAAKRKQAK
jgi:thiol-disulfide isomerase/thioredoxin